MAIPHSFSPSLFLALFLFVISFNYCSSSPNIASDQLKFWSENVHNEMPKSILNKLSPLTKTDSDYFSTIMSDTDHKFSADAKFCSLAKLACTSVFNDNKQTFIRYGRIRYSEPTAFEQEKIKTEDQISFFRLSLLKRGSLIHFPSLEDSLPDRSFLPSQIASKITLTSKNIIQLFPQAGFGSMKKSIETTLSICNATPIRGETRSCVRSLEEMIDFVKSTLGEKNIILSSLTNKNNKGSSTEVLIKKIDKFNLKKIVACHEVFLPFAAYLCHSFSSTRLYGVELVDPKTGAEVNKMVAICHMDTSQWSKDHVSFQILKFSPGQGEACHWFSPLALAWISAY